MILLLVTETFYLFESFFFIKGRRNFWKSSIKGWGTLVFSVIIGGENGSKLSLRKGIKVKVHSTATYTIFFQIGTTVISVILFPFLPRSCFVYAKIGPKPQLEDLIIELATP